MASVVEAMLSLPTPLYVGSDTVCVEVCTAVHSLLPQTCHDCRHAVPAISVLLTIGLGLVLVIIVVTFNFEASPTVDSLLFFTQVYIYII